mmetsp:Transcript_11313/g.35172  ORF Transcript_11313/g.35172 Transcript_11313/m.35172 type:complete len:316 (+) Transcript_11313:4405-5352(+)
MRLSAASVCRSRLSCMSTRRFRISSAERMPPAAVGSIGLFVGDIATAVAPPDGGGGSLRDGAGGNGGLPPPDFRADRVPKAPTVPAGSTAPAPTCEAVTLPPMAPDAVTERFLGEAASPVPSATPPASSGIARSSAPADAAVDRLFWFDPVRPDLVCERPPGADSRLPSARGVAAGPTFVAPWRALEPGGASGFGMGLAASASMSGFSISTCVCSSRSMRRFAYVSSSASSVTCVVASSLAFSTTRLWYVCVKMARNKLTTTKAPTKVSTTNHRLVACPRAFITSARSSCQSSIVITLSVKSPPDRRWSKFKFRR